MTLVENLEAMLAAGKDDALLRFSLGNAYLKERPGLAAEHLARASKIFEPDVIGLKRGIDEYKRLHNEAQRKRDDAALTAFTLVQIYLRAEVQGEACKPARDAIDRFMADWEHAQKEE